MANDFTLNDIIDLNYLSLNGNEAIVKRLKDDVNKTRSQKFDYKNIISIYNEAFCDCPFEAEEVWETIHSIIHRTKCLEVNKNFKALA